VEGKGVCPHLESMNILVWNVRGANGPGRALMIRGRIREVKPDIVCLVEHKVKLKKLARFKRAIWPHEWVGNSLVVDSGRILVLWNDQVVGHDTKFESAQMLLFEGLMRKDGIEFAFTAIYGENGHVKRRNYGKTLLPWNQMPRHLG